MNIVLSGENRRKYPESTCRPKLRPYIILKEAHRIKMALSQLTLLTLSFLVLGSDCRRSQRYSEELFLKHLPDGRVSAIFQFTTTWDVHPLDISRPSNGKPWGGPCQS